MSEMLFLSLSRKSVIMLFVIVALSTFAQSEGQTGGPYFSYSGSTGPDNWGTLSPNYALCSNGERQSPIDIVNSQAEPNPSLMALDIQYPDSVPATLVNNGYNVEVRFDGDAGVLNFNGKSYALQQMHWHTPSEHQIDGMQFAAELHLVHYHSAPDNSKLAVVSILLQSGQPDPTIAKIQQQLDELPKKSMNESPPEIRLGNLNIEELRDLSNTNKYYTYDGSLTTPPCGEDVTWIVIEKIGRISHDQIEALKRPLDDGSKNNARPVQALNGRKVEVFTNFNLLETQ